MRGRQNMKKARAHTRYELKSGTYIPGTTTITGLENKPFLVAWANRLGLEGINSNKYVDELATIGTLAHYLIECQLKNEEPDISDYTPNQLETASNPVKKFNNWLDNNKFEFISSELQLVSEKHRFGGTIDLYCKLNGKLTLIDLKTSKACYPEHYTQVCAYEQLMIENVHTIEDVRILRIGRDPSEGFDDLSVTKRPLRWKKFLNLRDIYFLNKEIG